MFTASWPKLAARGDDPVLGAKWLPRQILPADERAAVERHLGLISQINEALRVVEPDIAAYLGLNPSVRQSGEGPAYHGRITKQGRGRARGMLVGGMAAARSPGTLRAFYKRIDSRRREAHRGRRHCALACNDHLADAEQGRRLYLDSARLARP